MPVEGQLHVPPVVPSVTIAVEPAQTPPPVGPLIPTGFEFTVTGVVTVQPEPNEYVMVAVPAVTPVTKPVDDPTVAIVVEPLLHVPPPVASLSVVVVAIHTCVVPVIEGGSAFTVTVAIAWQPLAIV